VASIETVWAYREETLYPTLFGEASPGIYVLDASDFTEALRQETYDPRWLHLGVFECKPTATRPSWLYVTSGGSTPWEVEPEEYDPEQYSWLGVELVIETPTQNTWAIRLLLRLLAYQVCLCHGRFGDVAPLDYGHRIPIRGPIDPTSNSVLTHTIIVQPHHYPSMAQLDSGRFDFLHIVGVSETECDYAKQTSTDALNQLLQQHGAAPITDPNRSSVIV